MPALSKIVTIYYITRRLYTNGPQQEDDIIDTLALYSH